eukprot:TRINITY_DN362_c4_g3_i1.p1 TRINITY_DN362_c4_g3~~TRINITY_DN362_c4_g3_i1.p1  ORF type:complete len:183 (-),score=35.35 TRINITY_DN362_c4_g3_i1:31-579(-)
MMLRRWLSETVHSVSDRIYPKYPRLAGSGLLYRWTQEKNMEVLLAQRGKAPGKGMWSLPGGAIELGETVVEGIYRELAEEVNLAPQHANLSLPFHATDFIDIDEKGRVRFQYVVIQVCGEYKGPPELLRAGDDCTAIQWADIRKLHAFETLGKTVVPVVEKAISLIKANALNFLPYDRHDIK